MWGQADAKAPNHECSQFAKMASCSIGCLAADKAFMRSNSKQNLNKKLTPSKAEEVERISRHLMPSEGIFTSKMAISMPQEINWADRLTSLPHPAMKRR